LGINLVKPLGVSGISSNLAISPYRYGFGNNLYTDNFQNISVTRYMSETAIRQAINTNPNINTILHDNNMPVKLNMKELEELAQNHAQHTQNIAGGIINSLPQNLKELVDVKSVKDAAFLHDIGKVLIPAEILNKGGKFNDAEKEIMSKHSELGYELLKNSGIDLKTLKLIKYHHQNMSHSGYPKVPQDFFADINLQILTAADKYSALTEKRCYKDALDSKRALALIYKDVKEGNLHPFVFKALVNYVNSDKSLNTKHGVQIHS